MLIRRTIGSLIVSIGVLFIGISLFSTITLFIRRKEAQEKVTSAFLLVLEKQISSHSKRIALFLSQQIKEQNYRNIPSIVNNYMSVPGSGIENKKEIISDSRGTILFIRKDPSFPSTVNQKSTDKIDRTTRELVSSGGGIILYSDEIQRPQSLMFISISPVPDTDLWYSIYFDMNPIQKILLDIFNPLIQFRKFSLVLVCLGSLGFLVFIVLFSYFTIRKTDRMENDLLKANRELTRLSSLDGLTGIANRRKFDEYLSKQLAMTGDGNKSLSLLMADVDYFKKYNDTYGHLMGDLCLRRIAGVFAETCRRPEDLPARYGGEEFVVVLPGTTPQGAFRVAETIREDVFRMGIPHKASAAAPCVTLSIGLVTMNTGLLKAEDIIGRADHALYRAKEEGRNRTVIYPMDE